MKLRVLLIKEIDTVVQGQALYDQIKDMLAPKEPIEKDARVIDNHELED